MKLELDSFVKHTTGDSHAFVVSSMEIDAYLRRTANDGNDELFNVRTTTVNTIVHHNHDTEVRRLLHRSGKILYRLQHWRGT